MDDHEGLVALSSFNYEHGLAPGATTRALKRHSIPLVDVLGSKHIRRKDAARLIDLEARVVDCEDAA